MPIENKRPIIVLSNPFGFGPTGTAIAILDKLANKYTGEIVYGISNKCLSLVGKDLKKKVIIENIDERNEKNLSRLFKKYKNPFIVVCLNKVAIVTARKLSLDTFFVDPLTWLWNMIPEEYLRANVYYAFDIFDSYKKIKNIKNTKLIPPVLGKLPKIKKVKKDLILIHIGGFTNPLVPGFSKEFLLMLSSALNKLAKGKSNTKIIVAGGPDAISFMNKKLNKKVIARTLPKDIFLNYLSETKSFITTPGITATLEALSLKTPTSFLPPTNLSQWQQQKLFNKKGAVIDGIYWENYLSDLPNFEKLSEKEAIPEFWKLCKKIYRSNKLKQWFINDLYNLIKTKHAMQLESDEFIDAEDGTDMIVSDILTFINQSV